MNVVRQLFGPKPKFIKRTTKIFDLLLKMPDNGVGLKVIPTTWYDKKQYYTVTKVSPPSTRDKGRVYGTKHFMRHDGPQCSKQVILPPLSRWHIYLD